ncbi:Low-density lipoprotein receptor-related protein 4 [Varanus komodoensis]|nr:Low-density lipoprotein receptor-related protein 4 [Varanus komodoensis]
MKLAALFYPIPVPFAESGVEIRSIETIKVDGTGRYTFPDVLWGARDPLGLAVFEDRFFWADKEHLFSVSRTSLAATMLLDSFIHSFTVMHKLQQPPKLNILYSTTNKIYWLHMDAKGGVSQQQLIIEWRESVYLQDMDWKRGLIYWTDHEGELIRFNKEAMAKLIIPTDSAVCVASVDIPSGDVYWLTCDRTKIKVTTFVGMMTKTLYQATSGTLWHLFLDWQRASLFWLESGRIVQRMNLDGSDIKEVWEEAWADVPVAMDVGSCSFLWTSKDMVLRELNLATRRAYNLKERWAYEVAAAYGPYLVTFNKTALVVWKRSTMEPSAVQAANVQKALLIFNLSSTPSTGVELKKCSWVRWKGEPLHSIPAFILQDIKRVDGGTKKLQQIIIFYFGKSVWLSGLLHLNTQHSSLNLHIDKKQDPVTRKCRVCLIRFTVLKFNRYTSKKLATLLNSLGESFIFPIKIKGWLSNAWPALIAVSTVPAAKPPTLGATVLPPAARAATEPRTTSTTTMPITTPARTTTTTTRVATLKTTRTTTPTTHATMSTSLTVNCGWGEFACLNMRGCVNLEYLCDGEEDCIDGSDEESCIEFCSNPGMFKCQSGTKCISEQYRCDGQNNCLDGSDEADCWQPKAECALHCGENERCIPVSWLCDGSPDCPDESDEQNCASVECTKLEFRCRSGQCISYYMHCDGDHDCNDRSDEENCPVTKLHFCSSEEAKCPGGSGECILKEWLCDGDYDCKDESDEQNCSLPARECGINQWRCRSLGECIPALWRCDGEPDCRDQSDETACNSEKCQDYEFQCSGTCINYTLVCNGRMDCQGGLDEGGHCLTPCQRPCAQICYQSPSGPTCACHEGFRLESDRRSCKDINECKELDNHKCSQTCVNMDGSYSCICHPGYLLEPDGHTCKVIGSEPTLLVAVQFDLIQYGLRTMDEDIILTTEKDFIIFSIDFDLVEQKIYWMDLSAESIKWMNTKTMQKGTLVKGIRTDCIAVDWIGRNLYWTDGAAGRLLATPLNRTWRGNPEYTLVLDVLDQPRSLALYPQEGVMYWSTVGAEPQIQVAGMDGSNKATLIGEGLGWPTGITIDPLSWKIFWTDDKLHCIGSASLDGSEIKTFDLPTIQSPFSLTVFEEYIYWSDLKGRRVQRIDKKTGKNRTVLIKRHGQPYGLKDFLSCLSTTPSIPEPATGSRKTAFHLNMQRIAP